MRRIYWSVYWRWLRAIKIIYTIPKRGLTTESEVLPQWGQPENVWTHTQGRRVLEYHR